MGALALEKVETIVGDMYYAQDPEPYAHALATMMTLVAARSVALLDWNFPCQLIRMGRIGSGEEGLRTTVVELTTCLRVCEFAGRSQ